MANSTRTSSTTTETVSDSTGSSYEIRRSTSFWTHPSGETSEPYLSWEAYLPGFGRFAYGVGHELTDRSREIVAKSLKKAQADLAILPAAKAASLDHGRSFDARTSPHLCPVDFSRVKVGDLVWVLSYQCHRRGVVEAIGRTNLKVAVVVKSTGNFSRQSVKPGEVWWDTLND